MTAVGYVVTEISLTFASGSSVACAVTEAAFVPTTPIRTASTLCPDGSITAAGNTTWGLRVSGHIDWTPGSLWRYLNDSAGSEVTAALDPDGSGAVTQSGTVILIPPTPSMKVNDFATFTVTLPVVGVVTIDDESS